ncbi:protein rep [Enterococcus faecium]
MYRVWFCKSRLCPMCNWRRAMKHGMVLLQSFK